MLLTPAEQVAAALASSSQITLRDLQIALEWQRESEANVLDVLVFLELVDAQQIREAVSSLSGVPDLSINTIEARQAVDRRRQFKRIDLPEGIEVEVDGQPVGSGTDLMNLSLGGLGYTADMAPADGEHVGVKVRTDKGSVIETKARVRYRRDFGGRYSVGVEFDTLTPAAAMVLDSILKELES